MRMSVQHGDKELNNLLSGYDEIRTYSKQCVYLALICDECLTWHSDCIAILTVRYNRTPILSTHYKCAQDFFWRRRLPSNLG